MATEMTPQSRQPGQSAQVEPLKQQERIQADGSTPNFVGAMRDLAFTPSALAEVGQTMALQSGIAMAKSRGEKLGENPVGDVLPPITDVDKAFVNAYSAQSQATLGLQAQSLMNKSQEEVNSAYKLTPGLIESYQANVTEGLQDILNAAPSTIRADLSNQFSNSIMQSTHSLNMKMSSQQKEAATSEAQVYAAHQLEEIHNLALSGDDKGAQAVYENILKNISANKESGMWTPSQADTLAQTAKLQTVTSRETRKALDARAGDKLEGFLSDMIDNKPKDVSWSEWESVRSKVVGYIGAVENMENRDQSLIVSQANAKATLGPLEPEYIEKMRNQLTPARFNNFMANYGSKYRAQYEKQQRRDFLQANWTNERALGAASTEEKNSAFQAQTRAAIINAKNNGVELSEDDAQLESASTSGAPIPAYISKLNTGITSGNPELMSRDWRDYQALLSSGGQNARGITKESISMGNMFNHFLEQGMDPSEAGLKARVATFDKTPETRENTEQLIKDWRKSTPKDAAHRQTWARNIAGISKSTPITNGNGFAMHAQAIMEDNMRLTNGNVAVSEKMLQQGLNQYWGTTKVNGGDEFTYMPVEKVINLPAGATSLINHDVHHQLSGQVEATKEAYDKGNLSFYYRLKERPSIQDYAEERDSLRSQRTLKDYGKELFENKMRTLKEGLSLGPNTREKQFTKEIRDQINTVRSFDNAGPVEIEKVNRSGEIESYTVNIQASPMMQQSSGENPVIGDYDIVLRDKDGGNIPLVGAFQGQQSHAVYRPSPEWIKQNYYTVNGLDPANDTEERMAAIAAAKDRKADLTPDEINRRLMSYRGIF